jgi:hypothetical protein
MLPSFDRYPLMQNRFQDLIVLRGTGGQLPVATVSKRYTLVQHAQVLTAVNDEVRSAGINPAAVSAQLLITEYGTRVAIRATLPDEYAFRGADGEKVALTFECFNSVDRTVPLMAAVGWLRFVCSNGLVIGTTTAKVRQRHSGGLRLAEVSSVLADGMASALREREIFEQWEGITVSEDRLVGWVDGPLCEWWGAYVAARVYSIATTGEDGDPEPTRRKLRPHERRLIARRPVPGSFKGRSDAYGVAQALSWLACRRDNVAERIAWRYQIPALMSDLIGPLA